MVGHMAPHCWRVFLLESISFHLQSSSPRAGHCVHSPDWPGAASGDTSQRRSQDRTLYRLHGYAANRPHARRTGVKFFRRAGMVALDILGSFDRACRGRGHQFLYRSLASPGSQPATWSACDYPKTRYPRHDYWQHVPRALWLRLVSGSRGGMATVVSLDHSRHECCTWRAICDDRRLLCSKATDSVLGPVFRGILDPCCGRLWLVMFRRLDLLWLAACRTPAIYTCVAGELYNAMAELCPISLTILITDHCILCPDCGYRLLRHRDLAIHTHALPAARDFLHRHAGYDDRGHPHFNNATTADLLGTAIPKHTCDGLGRIHERPGGYIHDFEGGQEDACRHSREPGLDGHVLRRGTRAWGRGHDRRQGYEW